MRWFVCKVTEKVRLEHDKAFPHEVEMTSVKVRYIFVVLIPTANDYSMIETIFARLNIAKMRSVCLGLPKFRHGGTGEQNCTSFSRSVEARSAFRSMGLSSVSG